MTGEECPECESYHEIRAACSCDGEACDEEGDPGCALCRSLDGEEGCPAWEIANCPACTDGRLSCPFTVDAPDHPCVQP